MNEIIEYTAKKTGLHWRVFNSVYYDCHVVSAAQILPKEIYYPWLAICAMPAIEAQWGGLNCRNLLDSEYARDVVLLDQMGVSKHCVGISDDLDQRIQSTIVTQGHIICRVDSYYHEHFDEFYLKQHRTNGHKVTVIDWDEEYYYGIDNVGIKTLVLNFRRDYLMESIRSNLFHVYEKEDTFYYLDSSTAKMQTQTEKLYRASVRRFLENRADLPQALGQYIRAFERDVQSTSIRAYAQIHNSYTTALFIETAYTAIKEAFDFDSRLWVTALPNAAEFFKKLERSIKGWRMFKMLCKGHEERQVNSQKLIGILRQVIEAEHEACEVVVANIDT